MGQIKNIKLHIVTDIKELEFTHRQDAHQESHAVSQRCCREKANHSFPTICWRSWPKGSMQSSQMHSRKMAGQISPVFVGTSEECGIKCRCQGIGCRFSCDRSHSSESCSVYAASNVPCPWSYQPVHVISMPH